MSANPAATPERLDRIIASHRRYLRERARMEYVLRRAASAEPLDVSELPEDGSSVE